MGDQHLQAQDQEPVQEHLEDGVGPRHPGQIEMMRKKVYGCVKSIRMNGHQGNSLYERKDLTMMKTKTEDDDDEYEDEYDDDDDDGDGDSDGEKGEGDE